MLSYPINEAEELLASKLSAAKQNLANCEEDLDFLREQITVRGHEQYLGSYGERIKLICEKTMEVATARVYNWDITMKRKEKSGQDAIEDTDKDGSPNG